MDLGFWRRLQAAKGAKAYEKAEDPIYALEHNLPIDCQHYLEHHLSQPLLRIFEPMMANPRELLVGTPPPQTLPCTLTLPARIRLDVARAVFWEQLSEVLRRHNVVGMLMPG